MAPCKKVGQNTYYYSKHSPRHTKALAEKHGITGYNVVKVGPKNISFLNYPWFGSDPFPALAESWTVNISQDTVRHAQYNQDDPPILHRKELLLPESHAIRAKYAKMTERCEQAGLFRDTKRIGRKSVWAELLRGAGIPWVNS